MSQLLTLKKPCRGPRCLLDNQKRQQNLHNILTQIVSYHHHVWPTHDGKSGTGDIPFAKLTVWRRNCWPLFIMMFLRPTTAVSAVRSTCLGWTASPMDRFSPFSSPLIQTPFSAVASAAKLAALSWDPENLKKLSLNAYLQIFATKMPYLQIFATKMPYLQVFATKIALLNYMTKTQCLALILSVQDKINQLIANLFYWYAICFIDSQPVLSIANGFNDSQR